MTQEMLQRGFLASDSFYPCYAHQRNHIEKYTESLDEVFALISKAIKNNNVEGLLKGPIAHSGFRRLT